MRHTIARFAILVAAVAASAMAQDRRPEDPARELEGLSVPRNADGTVNTAALRAEIERRFAAGATEIQFRVNSLTQDEARRLLLVSERNLLLDIGAQLPNDGIERQVRFRGEVEARLQVNEEGRMRVRIENINLGDLSAADRAKLAEAMARAGGLDRVRIRGADGTRVEFRADRGIVRNEGGRVERVARTDNSGPGRGARVERQDRPERIERQRVERAERAERPERIERSGGGNSGRH